VTLVLMALLVGFVLLNFRLLAQLRAMNALLRPQGHSAPDPSLAGSVPSPTPPSPDPSPTHPAEVWRPAVDTWEQSCPTCQVANYKPSAAPEQQCEATTSTPFPGLPPAIAARAADNAWRCRLERGHVGDHAYSRGEYELLGCGAWNSGWVPYEIDGVADWQNQSCELLSGHSGPHRTRCPALHPTEHFDRLVDGRRSAQWCKRNRDHDGPHLLLRMCATHDFRNQPRLNVEAS
jgi:hypothetical protein